MVGAQWLGIWGWVLQNARTDAEVILETVLRQRDGIIREWEVAESDSNEDPVNTKIAKGQENKSFKGNRAALRRKGIKPHSSKGTRTVIKSVLKTKHSSLETCWSWGDIVNRGGDKPPFVLSQKLSESYQVNRAIIFNVGKLGKKKVLYKNLGKTGTNEWRTSIRAEK